MPRIICPVCNGTLDANYDLPADEYVHYPCTSCKKGTKNYCKACDGEGSWWENNGWGDCGILQHCYDCGGDGYQKDFVELEVECPRCKDDPPAKHPQGQTFDNMGDFFEAFAIGKIEFVCAKCNGTKKIMKKFYEDSQEYINAKKS